MLLDELLKLIRSQEGPFSDDESDTSVEVIVSLPDFFDDCKPDTWRFAANAGFNSGQMHLILEQIQKKRNIQDVWIVIYEDFEEDEEWPYSEACIISASATEDEINDYFPDGSAPTEISEIDCSEYIYKNVPPIKEGYSTYMCWWD